MTTIEQLLMEENTRLKQEIQLLKNENLLINRSLQLSIETLDARSISPAARDAAKDLRIEDLKTQLREERKGRCDDICSAAIKYRDDMIAKIDEIEKLRTTSVKDIIASAVTHDEEYLVDQDDFKTDNLYWGANCGHVTVWRLPEDLVIPDDKDFGDVFGNKWCLGEEWGGLNTVCIKTVTQEMIDCEQFHL